MMAASVSAHSRRGISLSHTEPGSKDWHLYTTRHHTNLTDGAPEEAYIRFLVAIKISREGDFALTDRERKAAAQATDEKARKKKDGRAGAAHTT